MDAIMNALTNGFKGAGGVFMWAILLLGMVGFAIAAERCFFIFIKCNSGRKTFMPNLLKFIKSGDINRAIKFAGQFQSPLAKVIFAILQNREKGEKSINTAVDEVFLTERPKIERYTPLLLVVANVATLIGLLGTIAGLILAFDAVAHAPVAQRATLLADGIAVAMATTMFGLMAAVPLLVFQGLINNSAERLIEEMDEKSAKMINILTQEG